jgi:hypothetical protein
MTPFDINNFVEQRTRAILWQAGKYTDDDCKYPFPYGAIPSTKLLTGIEYLNEIRDFRW